MRKLISVISQITLALLTTACTDPVQADLLDYVNVHIPKVAQFETQALSAYSLVSGENFKDDGTMYITIRDQVLPNYRKLSEGLEEISMALGTDEVRKLNEIYVEAVNSQFAAFTTILAALENQDFLQITSANDRLDKGRKLTREWQLQLKSICKTHNVEFK
jgi:hypothetical protein